MREEYDIAISEAVTEELSPPNFSYSHDALALIVEDSRRVHRTISERFAHDAEGYIDYLEKKRGASDQVDIVDPPSEPLPNTGKVTRHKI